jgi:hypothetical protein
MPYNFAACTPAALLEQGGFPRAVILGYSWGATEYRRY